MNKSEPKNITVINGVRKLQRWTVLDVDEDVTVLAKKFAKDNGYTLGKAVTILLSKALSE